MARRHERGLPDRGRGTRGVQESHKIRVSRTGDFNESDGDGDGTPFVTFDNGGSSCGGGGGQWQQQSAPRVVCATRDPSPPPEGNAAPPAAP